MHDGHARRTEIIDLNLTAASDVIAIMGWQFDIIIDSSYDKLAHRYGFPQVKTGYTCVMSR